MLTDYKFWYIRRDDNGFITDCAIRFYESEISTKDEQVWDETEKKFILKPVTKYRRNKRLQKADLNYLKKGEEKFIKELSGADAVLYTQEDFGQIKTDDELRLFLNKELAKDKNRKAIPEQKWQP